jgi:DNA polymerase-1
MKKLILIDGTSLLFRAFYGTFRGDSTTIMRAKSGEATNAVYALTTILNKIANEFKPDYALIAFDTPTKTFRHEEFKDYKAGRKEAPSDLIAQFPLAKELMENMGFFVYEKAGYEADDIIGTMAKIGTKNNLNVEIYSGDRDLLQLINKNVTVYLTKKGLTELSTYNLEALNSELGLVPNQIPDLKGLMGDASDNIPGIKGIGEVTALKLLHEHGSLEKVLAAPIAGKLGEKIIADRDNGIMSKRLATIFPDLELPFEIESTEYHGLKLDPLRNFYKKYDLISALKKLPSEEITIEFKYEVVNKIPKEFLNQDLAIIIEMMEDNYHTGKLIGMSLSNKNSAYFIQTEQLLKDDGLINYLQDAKYKKSGYDVKRTINSLARHKIKVANFTYDLALATYLIDTTLKDDPASVFRFYGFNVQELSSVYSKNKYEIAKVSEYACTKAYYLVKAEQLSRQALKDKGIEKLFFDIELPLVFVLAEMERNGISVDVNFLNEKAKIVQIKIDELKTKILEYSAEEFNPNSPSQLAVILFDKLMIKETKKRSTNADALLGRIDAHPIIRLILEYRRYTKLQSTYLVSLPTYVLEDGRIHTIYNQMLAQTGRLSSSEPNLQNITTKDEELKEVRKAFTAGGQGKYLLSFDYSQIELRVLAHLANSQTMIDAFNRGEDIHTSTAVRIFKVNQQDVNPTMRRTAKTVNFGIIYGISDWGLSEQLGIDVNESRNFINKYFEIYPEIKRYFSDVINSCEQTGIVSTMFGRYRLVKEINDPNYNVKEFGKRIAMNSPIQGSAADIIKIAMLKVNKLLKEHKYETKMILQIHDELVFEVPDYELMAVIPLINDAMISAVELKCKLGVAYEYGPTWYE